MKGLQTGIDAGAVGRAATSAVVTGITLIIVANAVIDWLAALCRYDGRAPLAPACERSAARRSRCGT
jgi:hypothetical protein